MVSSNAETDGAIENDFIQKDRNGFPLFIKRTMVGHKISFPKVVSVRTKELRPNEKQKENVLIDETEKFSFRRMTNIDEIKRYINNDTFIYGNNKAFLNESEMRFEGTSLKMFEVVNLAINTTKDENGKLHTRACFNYNNLDYTDIRVTDPDFFKTENAKLKKALIIVSLPHKDFNGRYYKFVAKIFPIE